MDVLESREAVEDGLELFAEGFRGEFDFASIEAYKSQLISKTGVCAHLVSC